MPYRADVSEPDPSPSIISKYLAEPGPARRKTEDTLLALPSPEQVNTHTDLNRTTPTCGGTETDQDSTGEYKGSGKRIG